MLDDQVRAGKVRAIAVSNETPWGVMTWLGAAQQAGAARIVAVQNPYSLLNRTFEIGLAEVAVREQVGLMAYSPLAMGMLTGKYADGARPQGARLTRFERFQRYSGERGREAAAAYVDLARTPRTRSGTDGPCLRAPPAIPCRHRRRCVARGTAASRAGRRGARTVARSAGRYSRAIHAANPNPSP